MFIVCFLRMFSLFLVKFFEFLLNVESINLLCKTWYVTGDNFLVEGRFPWKSKGIFHVVYPWSIDNELFFSKSWEEAAWSGNQISFRTILSYIHLMTYKNIQHTLTSSNFNLPIINWNCRWKFSQYRMRLWKNATCELNTNRKVSKENFKHMFCELSCLMCELRRCF